MSALLEIAAERCRQIEQEDWSLEHDDGHVHGELAQAALCYVMNAIVHAKMAHAGMSASDLAHASRTAPMPETWPWDRSWWKPRDPRRNLVRAAALIVAEIERLDRAAK